jgi:hypothetical protein
VRRAFCRDTWRKLKHPLHLAARLGDLQAMRLCKEIGKGPTDLDEDHWSCTEYATVYSSKQPVTGVLEWIRDNTPAGFERLAPIEPMYLQNPPQDDIVKLSGCTQALHKDCTAVHSEYSPNIARR